MLSFYRQRQFAAAWFRGDSLLPKADTLLGAIEWSVVEGLDTTGWRLEHLNGLQDKPRLDAELSKAFFRFALFEAFGLLRIHKKPHWDHPQRELDLVACLDSVVTGNAPLHILAPRNSGFLYLRKELRHLVGTADWPTGIPDGPKLEPGGRSSAVPLIRQRLGLAQPVDSLTYDSTLLAAVKVFQSKYGQRPDGVIGAGTVRAMNVSRRHRIEQLLVSMERLKWLPDDRGSTRVVANIPEFAVRVYRSDTVVMTMRAVVGKNTSKTRTPAFHDSLEYVVMRPFWHVPLSIVRDEILPQLREDPTYLDRHNMQVLASGVAVTETDSIDWTTTRAGDYRIRQRPGTYNSLGTVKFIFPNKHDVYFHDTNAKNYFDSWPRAHSHGCVRIDKPQEFAEFLLSDQKAWTPDSIASARSRGGQKQVVLPHKIPVWIVYITCTVDAYGVVHFWDDVYGYDEEVLEMMLAR